MNDLDEELGQIKRQDAHADITKIHRAVVIFVFNDKNELFMQQRSLTKDIAPGFWTISAGGHVGFGDSYEVAARRELIEELGVTAPLTFVHKLLIYSDVETEINSVYKTNHNGPFTLNETEIAGGAFFALSAIEDKIRTGEWSMSRWSLVHLSTVCRLVPERTDLKQFSKKLG